MQMEMKMTSLVLIKWLDDKYMQFDWMDDVEMSSHDPNELIRLLKSSVKSYLSGAKKLAYKTTMPTFYEESSGVID